MRSGGARKKRKPLTRDDGADRIRYRLPRSAGAREGKTVAGVRLTRVGVRTIAPARKFIVIFVLERVRMARYNPRHEQAPARKTRQDPSSALRRYVAPLD